MVDTSFNLKTYTKFKTCYRVAEADLNLATPKIEFFVKVVDD